MNNDENITNSDEILEKPAAEPANETAAEPANETAASPYKGFAAALDNFFGITKSGSDFKAETIGGLTTFMAMVYILMVNAGMFADGLDVSYGAVYIATALSAVTGTVLMALVARLPFALAAGMGLNAFFVYTICGPAENGGFGLTYANALMLIFFEGLLFIILTLTGLRKMLFEAIPKSVRVSTSAGIGLMIAFIGFKNANIVVGNPDTLVALNSLNILKLGDAAYSTIIPIFITLVAVIVMAVLSKKQVKGAVLYSILGAAALYYIFMGLGCAWGDEHCLAVFAGISFDNPFASFAEWGTQSVGKVFSEGFNFSAFLENHNGGELAIIILTSSLAFCMVDMFDTIGTLYGAAERGNLLDKDGNVPHMNQAMLCDAISTSFGAICGTSTVTTFVESSAGIGAGAKTGFASIVTALGFLVAMFLSPIAQLVPSCATAAALIYVGVLMINGMREIDWLDGSVAIPAFLTVVIMPFTGNISYGIGLGIISDVLIKLFTGKFKDINILTAVIGALFLAMFLLSH